MTEKYLQGYEADELELTDVVARPEDGLSAAVEHKLEDLGIPIPQEIELPAAEPERVVTGHTPNGQEWFRIPDEVRKSAEAVDATVIESTDDLIRHANSLGFVVISMGEPGRIEGDFTYPGEADNSTEPLSSGNPKDALGAKKPNLALVPPASSLYQAVAMMDGAAKYGPYNWRSNPVLAMVYIAAAQRHIAAYLDGEDEDPVSGVPHVGHALACLGIIADAAETGNLIDDRPVAGPAGDMVRGFNDKQSFD